MCLHSNPRGTKSTHSLFLSLTIEKKSWFIIVVFIDRQIHMIIIGASTITFIFSNTLFLFLLILLKFRKMYYYATISVRFKLN